MKMSESIANLAKAQAKVQAEAKDLMEDANGYNYKYVSLPKLLQYARPLLTKHGISFIQMPKGVDTIGLETIFMHESGEWISNSIELPVAELGSMNMYQSAGSAITYLRRYSLASFLGIASDTDNDASGKISKVINRKTDI